MEQFHSTTDANLHLCTDAEKVQSLPPAISIPRHDDCDSDANRKPLARATLAEVQAHLTLLDAQITADIRRHRALTELHDMALAMGATGASLVFDVIGATQNAELEVA